MNRNTNRYTGDFGDMEYDATGNLTQLGAPNWIMKWDAFDMQTQFTSVVAPQSNHLYAYGPGDYRLVTLDTSTQEITYDFRDVDGAVLREYTVTGSGAPERWNNWKYEKDFVHGPEGLLGTVTRTGTRHFSHKDHLGTPRAISDLAGVRRGRHDYYPYGHEVARSGQVDEPSVKFTGHQRDAHGLSDYMLGRTCLWPLRRFASVDPARDGWNLYAYVGNNPINKIDPDGKIALLAAAGIAWAATEAALAAYDVYEVATTLSDPSASLTDKVGTTVLAAAGVILPGGGYSKADDAVRVASNALEEGGGAIARRIDDASSKSSRGLAGEIGVLRDASKGKGNFGLGSATNAEADRLGTAWVGDGSRVASDGRTLLSEDGLRQYRPPSRKPNSLDAPTGTQANFERRFKPQGQWQSNGHLDIKENR